MRKIEDIYAILDEISPFELQERWDNSGLLMGDKKEEVQNIYIGLDVDIELVKSLEENSLLITHHPLIFKGLKKFDFSKYPANLIRVLIKKNISLISMHTNFDKTHLNRYVGEMIFGKEGRCENFICYFDVDIKFSKLEKLLKKKLNLKNPKVVKTKDRIKRVAICVGSGMGLVKEVDMTDVQCFLTGDIKYHEAFEAKSEGLGLIDIGHFESEIFFSEILQNELKQKGVFGIMSDSKNPFNEKEGI